MIGGLLGLVGLGKVKGSQKTTPLEALLDSFVSLDDSLHAIFSPLIMEV